MRTIQLTVSEADYEVLRKTADAEHRPIEQLIQEALAFFRRGRIKARTPLRDLPVLPGHQPLTDFPSRAEIYDEMFDKDSLSRP
jgi:hypothetical protein